MEELKSLIGRQFGPSTWFLVDQLRINTFADVTKDHQFIHVDPDMAKSTSFGSTIAHGFLTLSLVPWLTVGLLPLSNLKIGVNYGLDRVRFLEPVKVNQRVRALTRLISVDEKRQGQWLIKQEVTIEIEGEERPAMVAETLILAFI